MSPWVAPGSVFNEEYRHTSLIATLRKRWELGDPFTRRDATARALDDVFTLDTPRDPDTWAEVRARPVPAWTMNPDVVAEGLSKLGRAMGHGIIAKARELEAKFPAELGDPDGELPASRIVKLVRGIAWHFFPLLKADGGDPT